MEKTLTDYVFVTCHWGGRRGGEGMIRAGKLGNKEVEKVSGNMVECGREGGSRG